MDSLPSEDERMSEDQVEESARVEGRRRVLFRLVLRVLTYFAYDTASYHNWKDLGRLTKVLAETGIDEALPSWKDSSPSSSLSSSPSLSVVRRLVSRALETLVPCAISTVLVWVLEFRRRQFVSADAQGIFRWGRLLFRVFHRVARQAIVCRLFFPVESVEYSLCSALAIFCSFFREECLYSVWKITTWPQFFCWRQGLRASIRSLLYAFVFSLPLQELLPDTFSVSKRRTNVKKLIFFTGAALSSRSIPGPSLSDSLSTPCLDTTDG